MATRAAPATLEGTRLLVAAVTLALANFMVVLDMTVTNVSVPHISGGLGVSANQGTWTITSYSVAEAICVPLTGFLVRRFGSYRTFLASLVGFGVLSTLCGIAPTLSFLVVCRLGQGFAGAPLLPLTQTMMLSIFPREKQSTGMSIWAMTTIVAPIAGPILGGWISDHSTWRWIFFINIPVVIVAFVGISVMLRGLDEAGDKNVTVDRVGLFMLVVWVGALQLMLDKGQEADWFGSPYIVVCAIVAAIGFVCFLFWELTEAHPIVDISIFRHRGFTGSFITMALGFGSFFAMVVIIPQWLQQWMGYTATQAGLATGVNGVLAVALAPFLPRLMKRFDARLLVFAGLSWLAVMACLRITWTTDSTFFMIMLPQLVQGIGMPLFFVPITVISLNAVDPGETASAAGILAFGRSASAAVGTSLYTTLWADLGRSDQTALAGTLNDPGGIIAGMQNSGLDAAASVAAFGRMVESQAMMLATEHVFQFIAVAFLIAASTVWLAPRPAGPVAPGAAH